ncbi:alpha-hydroxy acid oxidase [Allobranchiibius sp. GilTou73]|uniref:alpha-hydroxy acid oxidase n=1 Tax=Allobranchiibius sp. GilTou73 TaxID=2904523 RepID=UPI001F1854F9|nr:alpha-hydroxy acid oxidase [Allobranchiibius sp. GilTou73]UIJ33637.1 alpha-hydroxy-acid oxidizing protein [Allobranchiibius sp. GilTou73]
MRETLHELEGTARERLDPDVWHYIARGAGDDQSAREAEPAWNLWRLRPRVLRDVSSVHTSCAVFGDWESPIGVAPTAYHRLVHPEGEAATARGAAASGAPFVLSSRSTVPLEQVAEQLGARPWWFQVYLMRERGVSDALALRAAAAGATALVLTGDTPYLGYRPIAGRARPVPLDDELALIGVRQHLPTDVQDPWSLIDQTPRQTLADIERLADLTGLPVIVKGVLRGDDALACVQAGAAGVWVSSHGGRQLDGAVPTAYALAEVVDAVGDRTTVLADGGVRCGRDALVALALGASAVFVGRPAVWALAAGGAEGVAQLLTGLREELGHLMGLAGATGLEQLDPSLVTRVPLRSDPR